MNRTASPLLRNGTPSHTPEARVTTINPSRAALKLVLSVAYNEPWSLRSINKRNTDALQNIKSPHLHDTTLIANQGKMKTQSNALTSWEFNVSEGYLLRNDERISLTATECLILNQFVSSEQRVQSREQLLKALNKDHITYTGLEMCLSRLQIKFKLFTRGERLIRSVRNKGYCLVQKIRVAD